MPLVLCAVGAAAVALLLTVAALRPGLAFWDTAELQAVGPMLGTAHPTGFPTYVILGWLASIILQPLGEPAFRMNLLSALLVASAAGLTAVLVQRLTGRAIVGLAMGILLAATPIAWSIGTHADAHALHLLLVTVLLLLLVDWERLRGINPRTADWRLIAASVTFGLSLGNHSLTLLFVPGIILFVLAVEPRIVFRPRLVGACLLGLVLAVAVVYAELPLRAGPFRAPLVYGRPHTWDGFWYIVSAAQFQGNLSGPLADLGPKLGELVRFATEQLGPAALLVPFGLATTAMRQPRYALLTVPTVIITWLFAASYVNAAIERYYLGPALIALTWVAVLMAAVVDELESLADGRLGGRTSAVIEIIVAGGLVLTLLPVLPTRWLTVDSSHDRFAQDWVDRVLDERITPRGAVIVSWWTYSTPLWYEQLVKRRRPDISIIDDRTRLDQNLGEITDVIDANLGKHPVVVIQTDPDILATIGGRYRLTQLDVPGPQPVYRVDGLLGLAGAARPSLNATSPQGSR